MTGRVDATVDPAARIATITTTFERPLADVWSLWSDPDKLARWWGPPGIPMTVDHHDLRPGGRVEVTVRAGSAVIRGQWSVAEVEPPRSLRFTFSSDGLEPTEIEVAIDPVTDTTTAMVVTARFASDVDLDHALAIGFVDGLTRSVRSAHAVG